MPANPQIRKFLYLEGEKAFISGLAEVLSLPKILSRKSQIHNLQIGNSQKRLGSQIRNVPHLRNLRKYNKLYV
jgi:hypothetical protein